MSAAVGHFGFGAGTPQFRLDAVTSTSARRRRRAYRNRPRPGRTEQLARRDGGESPPAPCL